MSSAKISGCRTNNIGCIFKQNVNSQRVDWCSHLLGLATKISLFHKTHCRAPRRQNIRKRMWHQILTHNWQTIMCDHVSFPTGVCYSLKLLMSIFRAIKISSELNALSWKIPTTLTGMFLESKKTNIIDDTKKGGHNTTIGACYKLHNMGKKNMEIISTRFWSRIVWCLSAHCI